MMQESSLSPDAVIFLPSSGNPDSRQQNPISHTQWAPSIGGQFGFTQHNSYQQQKHELIISNELVMPAGADAFERQFPTQNGPGFELDGHPSVYSPARPSTIAYRPCYPHRMTSPPYGGFDFDLSATSPSRPPWMSPTSDGRRSSPMYPVPFPSVSYGTSAYELPRRNISLVSPSSISALSPAHCRFAPKLEHIKEKKLYRRKPNGTSDQNKVSVGVQYEKEDQRGLADRKTTSRDCEVQTDFSDDIAQSLLVERPSSLYHVGSFEAASLDAEAGSSVNSDDFDSDSGYSSWRHRALLADCCCAASDSAVTMIQQRDQREDAATLTTTTVNGGWYRPHPAQLVDGNQPYQTLPGVEQRRPQPPVLQYVSFAASETSRVGHQSLPTPVYDLEGDWRNVFVEGASRAIDAGTATHDAYLVHNSESHESYDKRHRQLTAANNTVTTTSWSDGNSALSLADGRMVTAMNSSTSAWHNLQTNSLRVDTRHGGRTAKKTRRRESQLSRAADNERALIALEQKVLVEKCGEIRTDSVSQESKSLQLTRMTSPANLADVPNSPPSSLLTSSSVAVVVGASAADTGTRDSSKSDGIARLHGQYVREYCDHIVCAEIDECCLKLLQYLSDQQMFSCRDSAERQLRPTTKRRLVVGLREVPKQLRAKQLKCVVVAPNIEMIQSEGGLDDVIKSIIRSCNEQSVPVVFALGRKALGRACAKSVPVSVVGVFNCDGVEDLFCRLMELTGSARKMYAKIKSSFNKYPSGTTTSTPAGDPAPCHRDVTQSKTDRHGNNTTFQPAVDCCQQLEQDLADDIEKNQTTLTANAGNEARCETFGSESTELEKEGRHFENHIDGRRNDCRLSEISPDQWQLLSKNIEDHGNELGVISNKSSMESNAHTACHNDEVHETGSCNTGVANRPDARDVDVTRWHQLEMTKTRSSGENVTGVRQIRLANGAGQSAGEDEDESSTTLSELHVTSTTGNGLPERVGPRHEKQVWHDTGCIRAWTHGEQELVADSVC